MNLEKRSMNYMNNCLIMISTIRPHGAINMRIVESVAIERLGRYVVIDKYGNAYGIE